MAIIIDLLWAALILLFIGGCVVYAFRPHAGMELLKRSAVLLAVILIGPSFVSSVIVAIPTWVLILLGVTASVAAYAYLANQGTVSQHTKRPRVSHAERQPRLPRHGEDEE